MIEPHQKLPRWLVLVTWLLSMLAVIGTALAPAPPPPDWQHWAVLVLAAAVLGWFTTASSLVIPVVPHPPWNMQWRPLVLPAAVVSVAVVVTIGLNWVNDLRRGCDPPVSAAILTTPDMAATVSGLARRFESEPDKTQDGCPMAALSVTATDRQQIHAALAANWPDEGGFGRLGPRPVMVIDDKYVVKAAHEAHVAAGPPSAGGPGMSVVAHSPLILAFPGLPPRTEPGTWRETVKALSSQGYAVLRPEPSSSVVGSLAITLDYPNDARPGPDQPVDDRVHESRYSAALTTSGVGVRADLPTTVGRALCRGDDGTSTATAARDRLALVVPEFLVDGKDTARRAAARTAGCPDQQWPRFGGVEPLGGASVRLTVARLRWNDAGECAGARCPDEISDDFADWLAADNTGGSALQDLGWQLNDSSSSEAGDPKTAEDRYHAARTRARVVIAIDSSLSMTTHRRTVQESVRTLLDQLSEQDMVQVCTIVRRSAEESGRACHDDAVRQATDAHKVGISTWLGQTEHTRGVSGLPDVLRRSLADLGKAENNQRNTIVVITDVGGLNASGRWPTIVAGAEKSKTEIMIALPAGSIAPGLDPTIRDQVRMVTLGPGAVGEIAATAWRAAS